jgi:membrane peptidoglycan carboxypeptidase
VTSRADDFGVRYDDEDASRRKGNGAASGAPSGVDYDLGYADPGWDTQGYRTPSGGYDRSAYNQGAYNQTPQAQAPQGQGAPNQSSPNQGQGGYDQNGYDRGSYGSGQPQAYHAAPDYGRTETYNPAEGYGPPEGFGPPEGYGSQELHSPPAGYRPDEYGVRPDDYSVPQRTRTPSRHGGGPRGPGGPGGPGGPRGRSGKVKFKGSWWRHWTWKKAFGLTAALIGGFIVLIAVVIAYVYGSTPVPSENMAAVSYQESTVYADNGTIIGRLGDTNRQIINYSQIPKQIIYSVLSAEDRNFFNEGGVSPTGILRAAFDDLTGSGGSLQGGSTITQQFVRNYYQGIGTQQTASRKIKEIFVSMKVSKSESKPWILENYLNTIYLGQSSYGIAAAAQTYFDIPVTKLGKISWSQSALLAAIIQQPTNYPLPEYRADLEARWQYVRDGLLKMNWISQAQYNAMSFPKFGDYIPQNFGSDVWDPYVLNVVQNELEGVEHLSQSKIFNNGYKIVTTIDPAKMNALYQSVGQQETAMVEGGEGLQSYMHVGAILENPGTSAIEAMYGGPGYPGAKYNGTGKKITQKLCDKIHCEVNMAVYNQEQVGSSFKPYILATAVAEGMNVKTSMLDGQDFVCIPPDSDLLPAFKNAYPSTSGYPDSCANGWYHMSNDSTDENGAFSPQDAMTNSVNTAYADLWHYVGGASVVHIASMFGVNTSVSGLNSMEHEAGVALGQASLTVADQATMLAALDNGGVYHQIHIISSVTQESGAPLTIKLNHGNVFDGSLQVNSEMDSEVQYAMQKVAYSGTAAGVAGMTDGRQIISKTGTTNTAQSAFYIGAIPQEALAVALFTDHQSGKLTDPQTLNGLGGVTQAFGGTWPAAIWHTYAEDEFAPLTAEEFPTPVFIGNTWNLAPTSLEKPKPKKKPKPKSSSTTTNPNPVGQPSTYPTPTQTCPPGQVNVDCNTVPTGTPPANGINDPTTSPTANPTSLLPGILGGTSSGGATPDDSVTQAGAATVGAVTLFPATLFWVRRRQRKHGRSRRG